MAEFSRRAAFGGDAGLIKNRVPSGISLDKAPHVSAWIGRLEARPSWQSAVAPLLVSMQS